MRHVFTHHFEPLDLKAVEFSFPTRVAANPQANQRRLGEALDISAPNMAVTLDRLVARGRAERVRSTADRRAMHIHLAPAGVDLVERAEKIAATMENPALRALSAAERALLVQLLITVAGGRAGKRG